MTVDERLNNEYHAARLLLILDAFSAARRPLRGLTKLAKLDFLIRYPRFLARLLDARGLGWPAEAAPGPDETPTEAAMIRYKYGPWDDSYYPVVGALVARGLVERTNDSPLTLRLTTAGTDVAATLRADPVWARTAARADLLQRHFDLTGNALKNLIYAELPDAVDRPHRSEIL